MLKKFLVLSLLVISLLTFALPLHAKGDAAGNIGVSEAAALLNSSPSDLLILDVRTPAEYRQGHIPGARNMDFFGGKFDMDVLSLPKDRPILVYCRSGKRSAGAAEIMRKAGIKNVMDLTNGIDAWEKAGMPIEKPE